MKKALFIFSLAFYYTVNAQTIPNAGFETWVTNTESPEHYLVPQNWITADVLNNTFNSTYTVSSVVRSTISHSGTYAVLLQTAIGGGDTVNGSLYSCNSLANLFSASGFFGFPFTTRPALFQGYYKFTSVGGDVVAIAIILTKWNTSSNKRDTINTSSFFFTNGNATSYTQFSVPLTYTINEYPDTANIIAEIGSSTGNTTHVGTQLYLDDLGSSGSVPLGIEQYSENDYINIYPNPSSSIINVELKMKDVGNTQYTLYDINGKAVKQSIIYNLKSIIDISDLNEGVYNISIISNEGVINKRVVIVK